MAEDLAVTLILYAVKLSGRNGFLNDEVRVGTICDDQKHTKAVMAMSSQSVLHGPSPKITNYYMHSLIIFY